MKQEPTKSLSIRRFLIVVAVLAIAGSALAYDQYSANKDATNCRACHGDYRATPYTEQAPGGGTWADGLHNTHRYDMLDGDCDVCHTSGGRFPVLLGSSNGGTGLAAVSCSGCHGRAADGTGTGSEGYGAGLRQHHWRADADHPTQDLKVCLDCHADSDPAAKTPAGEDVLAPYYANPGLNHPNMPTEACDPAAAGFENYVGLARGLDNDGDAIYDDSDPDCSGLAGTPGETSGPALQQLMVTAHDPASGVLTLSYGAACSATENSIEFGDLAQVASYSYSGRQCAIGTTGSYDWSYPAGSLFFLIVADDGVAAGSYGTNSGGTERPDDLAGCVLQGDLGLRCD